MAKKLISVWLSLTIVFFSSISIYADEYVQGDFFNKEVVVNGSRIVNYNLQYPFFLYKDTTYFPLTPEMGKICGFKADMDWESRTLKLLKTEVTQKKLTKDWAKNNGESKSAMVLRDVKIEAISETQEAGQLTEEAAAEQLLAAAEPEMEELNLGDLPVLTIGKQIFLPLKVMKSSKVFGWDLYYDSYFGTCISTVQGVSAKSYWPEAESRYNKGLVNYIQRYNPNLSKTYCQDLVSIFKRAGKVYGVDEKILIAIAQKESTFNAKVVSRGGAVGMMQIMPATGAGYGASVTDLKNPRTNINIAASMIGNSLKNYGGDKVRALSAYNYGSLRVSRGTYSSAYASGIMQTLTGVNNFLSANGYK